MAYLVIYDYLVSLSTVALDGTISPRPPLTKGRVLQAAVDLCDRDGLGALTMRRLGTELGVEAMSLYKHVTNKEEILDGIVEVVVGEIAIPSAGSDWKQAMRRRARSAREVLSRHSWAIGLLEARGSTGPSALRYLDTILGNLRSAGFSIEHAAHAFWLLDCYVYGQVIQETAMRLSTSKEMTEPAGSTREPSTTNGFPHLAEVEEHARKSGFTFDGEFEFGLDLILDALDRTATSVTD
ncbi:MAG: TetR/AcrR family transcriptional regulator [Actinomycetota bacterium]|nr:TetR/AcrR family transcriptional regulator [Actinomycetota bacterium]MDH5223494.1 TetR/AcrR family transcriptional regulator [Actinomycetota bacterium]MDH5312642.1 TetR/AcrR family transcriptional regulator [Actinomycetota bacterium]